MPNYVLDSSATQVNTAINNVVNAQGTPTNGSNLMVTSNGIYQALQDIQHTNFNTGTLVTSADTIASNNSDTQIPTTQAVASYLASKVVPTVTEFKFGPVANADVNTITLGGSVSGGGAGATLANNIITVPSTGTSFLQYVGDVHTISTETLSDFAIKVNGTNYFAVSGSTSQYGYSLAGLRSVSGGDEITVQYGGDGVARTGGSIFVWNYGT
jgi:hypothetical protein